ncbi:MAG: imidazoleglycerol-phosphate dehydratase HisB [Lachnospiraceae bacterium]|nr:imidazoleglycerol-phosphate dehydratase HisB [Lachnospiraceae bacterium]
MGSRIGSVTRKTNETNINVTIHLDGKGETNIKTGIGFFDHMLHAFARHGLFDLDIHVAGDLEVDCHHTVEDTGIVLGQAILQALGDKVGINRYGHFTLPMDETLALCAIDLSGRSYFSWDCTFTAENIGDLKSEMIHEFFHALSANSGMNLHLKILDGNNNHHLAEALFKSFGRALDMATLTNSRLNEVWSTKGAL